MPQRQRASARKPLSLMLHWAHLSASAQGSSRPEVALIVVSHRSQTQRPAPQASQASPLTSLRSRGSCQGVPRSLAVNGGFHVASRPL